MLRAEKEGLHKGFRYGNSQGWKEGDHSLYHSSFHFKRQHLCVLIMVQPPQQSSLFQGSNRQGLWRCHTSPSQRIRQYLSSPIALTFYWQSPRFCLADVSVWIHVIPGVWYISLLSLHNLKRVSLPVSSLSWSSALGLTLQDLLISHCSEFKVRTLL